MKSIGAQVAIGLSLALFGIYFQWLPFQSVFQQWATVQHECFHALMGYLTGGSVVKIELTSRGGTAWITGGIYTLISLAGYMGTSAYAGSLLYTSTKNKGYAYFGLTQIVILAVLVFNAFGQLATWTQVLLSSTFLFATWRFKSVIPMVFASGLLFFSSLSDIGVLLGELSSQTDAALLAQHWGLPFLQYPLAITHVLVNFLIWGLTLRFLWKSKIGKPKSVFSS